MWHLYPQHYKHLDYSAQTFLIITNTVKYTSRIGHSWFRVLFSYYIVLHCCTLFVQHTRSAEHQHASDTMRHLQAGIKTELRHWCTWQQKTVRRLGEPVRAAAAGLPCTAANPDTNTAFGGAFWRYCFAYWKWSLGKCLGASSFRAFVLWKRHKHFRIITSI